jgi:hypothetical protein
MGLTPFAVPTVLNNGAEVFALKGMKGRHWVVLAKTDQGIHPWVTWAVDQNGDAYWGHYFATQPEAYDDWEKRSL